MTATTSPNDVVLTLLSEVNRRKAEIVELEGSPNYKTNRLFSYVEHDKNQAFNISPQAKDVGKLLKIAAFLQAQSDNYHLVVVKFGMTETAPKWTWMGHTLDAWLYDIKTMIAKETINKKKEELQKLEDRLNALVSPELRRQLELEAIKKEMGL